MSAVTKQEIVEALLNPPGWLSAEELADRIKQHGIAPPDGWVLVPEEILDLTRFMCRCWSDVDKWVYNSSGADLMSYPVIQGTSNQIKLSNIGLQVYDANKIPNAVKWMLDNAPEVKP